MQDVDEVGVGPRGQVLVDRGEPPTQPTFGHETPSSFPVGFARHYVIMTSPAPELQQIANPARASRMGAMLVGMGTLHFAAPKPFDSHHS